MKRVYIAVVLMMTLGIAPMMLGAPTEPKLDREYPIKVGFLYNFMKFTNWPAESVQDDNKSSAADSNEPMTIGVIGKDPFGKSFEVLRDKLVRNRKIVTKRFKGFEELKQSSEQIEAIKKCHVLFICSSEEVEFRKILDLVKDHAVLTVADTKGFLESGGIINFVPEEKKIRFEVNVTTAKRAKLNISSKLLSLAKRTINEKQQKDAGR